MKFYYEQDGITIYHGEALAVLRTLPAEIAQGVVTDPPYSSGGTFRGDRAQATRTKYVDGRDLTGFAGFTGDNRDQRSYAYWSALWLSECLRLTVPGAPCCVFTDWRQLPTTTDALQAGGWVWRGIAAWDKTEAARPAKGRFRNQCEYLAWGSNGSIGTVLREAEDDAPCLPGFFRQSVNSEQKYHIAGKPLGVMRQILEICPPDGLVLDPFMGSGTVPIACKETGRSCIAVEMLEANCEIAAKRLAQGVLFGQESA